MTTTNKDSNVQAREIFYLPPPVPSRIIKPYQQISAELIEPKTDTSIINRERLPSIAEILGYTHGQGITTSFNEIPGASQVQLNPTAVWNGIAHPSHTIVTSTVQITTTTTTI